MRSSGGQLSVNRGSRLRPAGRPAGRHERSARRRAFRRSRPAASTARSAIRRSFVVRDNQHFELYDNLTLDRGAHRLKFGAYYFHLQLRPEQPDNARGAFTYTGQFTRQRVRRFPARLPDVGRLGHRPRRRGRPHELAAPLRAGRLAGARQPDVQPRPALRVQPAHVRRGQPAVVDRSRDAGRPVRHRERRRRRASIPSAQALLPLIPIPYVTSQRGRLGPRAARPERRAAGAAHGLRAVARRRSRRSSAAATASS